MHVILVAEFISPILLYYSTLNPRWRYVCVLPLAWDYERPFPPYFRAGLAFSCTMSSSSSRGIEFSTPACEQKLEKGTEAQKCHGEPRKDSLVPPRVASSTVAASSIGYCNGSAPRRTADSGFLALYGSGSGQRVNAIPRCVSTRWF